MVLDGFGLDPQKEWDIVSSVWSKLPDELTARLAALEPDRDIAIAALAPTSHGVARRLEDAGHGQWDELFPRIKRTRDTFLQQTSDPDQASNVDRLRCKTAAELHYVPWSVDTPFLFELRQLNTTWITRTAGVFTGFEDLTPEIMGNSDTGHQQIFNLCVARQIPAFISHLVESGAFFENEQLNTDLKKAAAGGVVVFKTLLSGEFGDDGYVHSAWKHMLAFFKLYFEVLGLPPASLQVEAVLDGRDCPYYSSLRTEEKDGVSRYGFLHKLRKVLANYGAESCLAWIIGRQFMDRDYKGAMIRNEYELVTANAGRRVADLDEALALVAADHEAGDTDPMVRPIVIGSPRTLDGDSLLFNGVFRADRQEPITAALLGYREFIEKQATQKRRVDTWDGFTWLAPIPGLTLWAMIDYHDAFVEKGVKSIYKDSPHPHNVLHLMNEALENFHFLFLTEGVKEKHMGLFSRGRRSTPLFPSETQVIIPTHGKEQGVASDNDLYKVPQMRHPEIADRLVSELENPAYDLIAVNFPGADMLGHLVQNHFDACGKTLLSLEDALTRIIPAARQNGWFLILTADHGNIDHYGPDHGNHDVLTTLLLPPSPRPPISPPPQVTSDPRGPSLAHPAGGLPLRAPPECDHVHPPHPPISPSPYLPISPPLSQARLFDIAWTILASFSLTPDDLHCPPFPPELASDSRRLIGTPLVGAE